MNFGTIQVANIFVGTLNAIEAYFGTEKVWGKSEPATPNWLCFTAEGANSTVRLDKSGSPNAISLETSTDGNTWTDYTWSDKTGDTLTLTNIGDKVYMRAKTENKTIGSSNTDYYKFVMTGKIAESGNIQTLLKADCSRTDAPAYCYKNLFNGCQSLTTTQKLPATKLAAGCYSNMFEGCSSLTTAPELSATKLAAGCYKEMFKGCTSLTTAPALPVTALDNGCYSGMFYDCTSLTQAPELPATTLAMSCYQNMFRNCTSLTTAPELPATTLAPSCYQGLFYGCSNLNTITLDYTDSFSTNYFNYWVYGVASSGTFYYNGTDTTTGVSAIPTGWTVVKSSQELSALCFTAEEANSTLHLDKVGSPNAISLETSMDGNTWTDYSWSDKTGTTLTLTNIGDKVYMRAKTENQTIGRAISKFYRFKMSGKIAASGNIQTLLKADGSRTDAPAYCYCSMFSSCSSLTQAPELPATTLAGSCYYSMFASCTSLTTAPALPATTLVGYCYSNMFSYCSKLNTIKLGYTGNFADAPSDAFGRWVEGVPQTGTFYYNGSDTTTGVSAIPEGWTVTPFTS